MDFYPKKMYSAPTGVPIPFFMAYPNALEIWQGNAEDKNKNDRDFEYMQQTYPVMVRRYRCRVKEILDTLDYEGSMIYDEYPDRLAVQSLGLAAAKTILREEEEKRKRQEKINSVSEEEKEGETRYVGDSTYLEALIQVLVCDEIYYRRQKKQNKRKISGDIY